VENSHICKNRGYAVRMEKSIVRKWIPRRGGTQTEVIRWTCPACGYSEIQVDTHGASISDAQMTALLAL